MYYVDSSHGLLTFKKGNLYIYRGCFFRRCKKRTLEE